MARKKRQSTLCSKQTAVTYLAIVAYLLWKAVACARKLRDFSSSLAILLLDMYFFASSHSRSNHHKVPWVVAFLHCSLTVSKAISAACMLSSLRIAASFARSALFAAASAAAPAASAAAATQATPATAPAAPTLMSVIRIRVGVVGFVRRRMMV